MDLQTFSRLFAGVINMNLNGKVFDEILSTQLKPKNEKKKKNMWAIKSEMKLLTLVCEIGKGN